MGQRDWDQRYLQLAAHISTWSKDHKKVGAVLVRGNRIVGAGFNGLPSGVQDDYARLSDSLAKNAMVVHAEENALLVAGDRARGATLYVHGLPVCARCASSIIQAGVAAVVSSPPGQEFESLDSIYESLLKQDSKESGDISWDAMGALAIKMFQEARITRYEVVLSEHATRFMSELGYPPPDRRNGRDRRKPQLSVAAE